jgi:hypothetical protein
VQLGKGPVTQLTKYAVTGRGTSHVEASNKYSNQVVHTVSRIGPVTADLRVLAKFCMQNHSAAIKFGQTGSPWEWGWLWWIEDDLNKMTEQGL